MVHIDGSERSGSGTILRYSLALAALLREDVTISRIRAKRDKPGLRPQHLAAAKACADISGARVEGAHIGSNELVFRPGSGIKGGTYHWDIGTAGSSTMLALALLPVAAFGASASTFTVSGGVFQDFAPSPFHMQHVLLPMLGNMGIQTELEIERPGYVPAGNGLIRVGVNPIDRRLAALSVLEQGEPGAIHGIAISSHLSDQKVSERMAKECERMLSTKGLASSFDIIDDKTASQPGASLAAWTETSAGCRLGADSAGQRGRSSESIGRHVAANLIEDLQSGATVDRFLADQLIIFAALAEGVTEFRIPVLTDHVDANLWLVEEFGVHTRLEERRLSIEGLGAKRWSL